MRDSVYFDLCAMLLFSFLCFSVRNLNYKTCKSNKMLRWSLIFGVISSCFAFTTSNIMAYIKPSSAAVAAVYIHEYMALIFEVLMIQFNSYYFFRTLGLSNFICKSRFLTIQGIVVFVLPFAFLLSNIFAEELFFVTPTLNIGTSPLFLTYYISIGLILVKDGVVLICLRKYLTNKRTLFTLIAYALNILFIIFQCVLPDLRLFTFVFALSVYIEITFIRSPALQESPLTGAMSRQAFYMACEKIFLQKTEPLILFIKIKNYKNIKMYVGQKTYLEYLHKLSETMKKECMLAKLDSDVYYLGHGVYTVIIFNRMTDKVSRLLQIINTDVRQQYKLYDFPISGDVVSCLASIPKDIGDIDYLREFTKTFDHIFPDSEFMHVYEEASFERNVTIKNRLKEILELAIRNNSFEVYYQPVYGVEEKRYISAEALIRIKDPEFGIILPSVFIPYAEKKDYIHYINDFVMDSVCKFIASEDYKKSGLKYIGMNLSAAQCLESDFTEKIEGYLQEYQVSAEDLRFEIREATAAIQPEVIEQRLQMVHEKGIKFVLDGYGTGYSNIKHLRKLPFDIVKLDKTFVENLKDPETFAIIIDVVNMFKHLNKQVLVEGIESKEMADVFIDISSGLDSPCEFMQGYYYSKACTQQDLLEFLNK